MAYQFQDGGKPVDNRLELTAKQCVLLAQEAVDEGMILEAEEFLEEAMNLYDKVLRDSGSSGSMSSKK